MLLLRSKFLILFWQFVCHFLLTSGVFAGLQAQDSSTDGSNQDSNSKSELAAESTLHFSKKGEEKKLVFSTTFENESGLEDWIFSDSAAWKLAKVDEIPVLSQFRKESNYRPQVRSPLHQAILKSPQVESFELCTKVRSTHANYGHRDVCLFFGYQSPTEFYYVHLGMQTDPHCNQIFIVNNSERTKITISTNSGTPWDENWHVVKIVRDAKLGKIDVYFDEFDSPAMTASDRTFTSGRVGIGSFDDTADWSRVELYEIKSISK
jgi:hypothetical protein